MLIILKSYEVKLSFTLKDPQTSPTVNVLNVIVTPKLKLYLLVINSNRTNQQLWILQLQREIQTVFD